MVRDVVLGLELDRRNFGHRPCIGSARGEHSNVFDSAISREIHASLGDLAIIPSACRSAALDNLYPHSGCRLQCLIAHIHPARSQQHSPRDDNNVSEVLLHEVLDDERLSDQHDLISNLFRS